MISNCDPRDRFVHPYLARMMDSFSCVPYCRLTVVEALNSLSTLGPFPVFFHFLNAAKLDFFILFT